MRSRLSPSTDTSGLTVGMVVDGRHPFTQLRTLTLALTLALALTLTLTLTLTLALTRTRNTRRRK